MIGFMAAVLILPDSEKTARQRWLNAAMVLAINPDALEVSSFDFSSKICAAGFQVRSAIARAEKFLKRFWQKNWRNCPREKVSGLPFDHPWRSFNAHEMHRAPSRSRRRLRLLRTRALRRLRQTKHDRTHDLLRQLRRRARAQRYGVTIDSSEKPAKRAGQRVLFLSVRRTFGGGRGRRVVLSARAVSDLVHRRMWRRFYCVGNLVWPDCTKK
jgi:hypothetical protein